METNQINFTDVIQGRFSLEDLLALLDKEQQLTLLKEGKAVAKLTPIIKFKKKRIIGLQAGGGIWMADDFNAPLNDFQEYM